MPLLFVSFIGSEFHFFLTCLMSAYLVHHQVAVKLATTEQIFYLNGPVQYRLFNFLIHLLIYTLFYTVFQCLTNGIVFPPEFLSFLIVLFNSFQSSCWLLGFREFVVRNNIFFTQNKRLHTIASTKMTTPSPPPSKKTSEINCMHLFNCYINLDTNMIETLM